jgi:hypothetical protein
VLLFLGTSGKIGFLVEGPGVKARLTNGSPGLVIAHLSIVTRGFCGVGGRTCIDAVGRGAGSMRCGSSVVSSGVLSHERAALSCIRRRNSSACSQLWVLALRRRNFPRAISISTSGNYSGATACRWRICSLGCDGCRRTTLEFPDFSSNCARFAEVGPKSGGLLYSFA